MVQPCTARRALQSARPINRTAARAVIIAYVGERDLIPNGGRRSSRPASVFQPDRFRTTDMRACALNS